MNKKTFQTIILVYFIYPSGSYANTSLFDLALAAKYIKAVLHIQVFEDKGNKVYSNAGTLIGPNGHALTAYHALHPRNVESSTKTFISLKSGYVFKKFKILKCFKVSNYCLLKLPFKPKVYFKMNSFEITGNTPLYLIGHPGRKRFLAMKVNFLGLRRINSNELRMRISMGTLPGTYGGPVFNQEGTLVGLSARAEEGKKTKDYLAISRPSMDTFIAPYLKGQSP